MNPDQEDLAAVERAIRTTISCKQKADHLVDLIRHNKSGPGDSPKNTTETAQDQTPSKEYQPVKKTNPHPTPTTTITVRRNYMAIEFPAQHIILDRREAIEFAARLVSAASKIEDDG